MKSKYPSIGQFRNLINAVEQSYGYTENADGEWERDHNKKLPTLEFLVTTKMHGTNASVVFDKDGTTFQSRRRRVTPESDNAGFAAWATVNVGRLNALATRFDYEEELVIFGEWCCGNIAKGVSLNDIPEKHFIIFGIKADGKWIDVPWIADFNIRDVAQFGQSKLFIDFEHPERMVDSIIDKTMLVEEECPVGKFLKAQRGDESTCTIGEGVVLSHITPEGELLNFKSKGEKHQSSKVRTLTAVDIEKLENVDKFVEYACTDSRLNQMFDELEVELHKKNTGLFVRAMCADIIKEELDTLEGNGLTMRDVGGKVAKVSSRFYLDKF